MGLLSFFRREPAPSASGESPSPRKRGAKATQVDHAEQVQLLRQRARHRLIGAAVLVGIGIVAFPLVFETQPRPVPMDLPIVIPSQDSVPRSGAPAPVSSLPANLPEAAQAQVVAPVPDATPAADASDGAAAADVPVPVPQPPAARKEPTEAKSPPEARYVVQVGAFADKKSAQEARQRLERKGLKTYAQVAQTKDGERIRVRLGPFANKAEADKAAAAAQSVGLAGKVLTL